MASFNANKGLAFKECKPFFVPNGDSVVLWSRGHHCVIFMKTFPGEEFDINGSSFTHGNITIAFTHCVPSEDFINREAPAK